MNGINRLLYPDSGNLLEDASVLRNAVYFSTAERAYSAQLVLQQPLNVNQRAIDFLVIKAYEEFMTSTEDLIGWLFTLQEWQPGNAEYSLFLLLDKIQVGKRGHYEEKRAVSILENLDGEGFRKLCHIPTNDELINAGASEELVDNISRSIPRKLEGWLKIAKRRAEKGRGWVRMFNKFKHHMLAFPTRARDKDEIWMPTSIKFDEERGIGLGQGWLESSINKVRRLAGDAIAAQAVLHDTLAVILSTRYDERYTVPQWVVKAYQTDYLWQK